MGHAQPSSGLKVTRHNAKRPDDPCRAKVIVSTLPLAIVKLRAPLYQQQIHSAHSSDGELRAWKREEACLLPCFGHTWGTADTVPHWRPHQGQS